MTDPISAVGTIWSIGKDLIGQPGHFVVGMPEENASTYLSPDGTDIPVEVVGNYAAHVTYVRHSFIGRAGRPAYKKAKLRVHLALYYQLVKLGPHVRGQRRPVHIRHCHLELADGRRRNLFHEAAVLTFTVQCNDSDKGPFLLWTWNATTDGRFISRATENSGTFSLYTDGMLMMAPGDSSKYFRVETRAI